MKIVITISKNPDPSCLSGAHPNCIGYFNCPANSILWVEVMIPEPYKFNLPPQLFDKSGVVFSLVEIPGGNKLYQKAEYNMTMKTFQTTIKLTRNIDETIDAENVFNEFFYSVLEVTELSYGDTKPACEIPCV